MIIKKNLPHLMTNSQKKKELLIIHIIHCLGTSVWCTVLYGDITAGPVLIVYQHLAESNSHKIKLFVLNTFLYPQEKASAMFSRNCFRNLWG